jgi:predicted metal-dependent hydrolase
MRIGHSHTLRIAFDDIDQPKSLIKEQVVSITAPNSYQRDTDQLHHCISRQIRWALRREAMAYLPRRLSHLAQSYGFEYARERFGNQSGRWGSCSTSGTISLNVALMNLPLELIDYVLIHELAHTKQMNHSPAFWDIVEECMPEYRQHRKILKTMSPIC